MSAVRFVLAASLAVVALAQSPDQLCLQNVPKYHIADPSDCHYYYQCHVTNATHAIASRQHCPPGQFWREPVMACLPEGSIPCTDRCLSEANTAARGCYAGTGCRQYYVCSNTGSNGMCCPEGSTFVEATCGCEESTTCTDSCVQQGPAVATTVAPASQINATVCRDSYGSDISIVPGELNAYVLLTEEGWATDKMYCAAGTAFNIVTCRCDIEDENSIPNPTVPTRKATLVINFDQERIQDASTHNYAAFAVNGAERVTNVAAHGSGSLAVNGGYVSIPGLKSFDQRDKGSWCAFFRGTGSGGIFSNNLDAGSSQYSTVLGPLSASMFSARLNFWLPVGGKTLQSAYAAPANGWNHFCVTFDTNESKLYLNGQLRQTQPGTGFMSISHSPIVIGYDATLGHFNGHIDEVLITPFAMTAQEVNFHRNGNYGAMAGFF